MNVVVNKLHLNGDNVFNVNKPLGLTSFGVVKRIRYWTGIKKVGHAGTLDPLATGVLIVCTGPATKRISEFMDMEKEYEAVIELGKRTTTDDGEGEIIEENVVPKMSRKNILSALSQFEGDIKQIPPHFSALKRNGQRSYQLARRGQFISLGARCVRIIYIELLSWKSPLLRIRVACSKGTYIRALARDMGEHLGTGAYLKTLKRTRIGSSTIEESLSLEQIKELCISHANL